MFSSNNTAQSIHPTAHLVNIIFYPATPVTMPSISRANNPYQHVTHTHTHIHRREDDNDHRDFPVPRWTDRLC